MKKYTTFFLGLITTLSIYAQDKEQYLNINAGGGLHSLKYNLLDGETKGGIGGALNIGYSYFFNSDWGLGAGLGIKSAQATGTLNVKQENDATDQDGDDFILRTNYEDWKEKQNALFLDIPIGIQYQHRIKAKTSILASGGINFSVPISSGYKVTSGSIITSGYYPQWNVELTDMPQHGFTTYSERPDGDLDLKTSMSVYGELGALYNLSDKLDLYAGAYASYGISSIKNSGINPVSLSDGTYYGVASSYQADNMNLLTFGVKVGVRMHISHRKKTQVAPLVVPVAQEPAPEIKEEPKPEPAPEIKEEPKPEPVAEPVIDPSLRAREIADKIQMKFLLNTAVPTNDVFDNEFKELAEMLKANPSMKVRIKGHTCNLASRTVNQKIGMQRAVAGKEKLMKYGVPDSQIILESKAFDEPLVPNTSEENRIMNRRIELKIE